MSKEVAITPSIKKVPSRIKKRKDIKILSKIVKSRKIDEKLLSELALYYCGKKGKQYQTKVKDIIRKELEKCFLSHSQIKLQVREMKPRAYEIKGHKVMLAQPKKGESLEIQNPKLDLEKEDIEDFDFYGVEEIFVILKDKNVLVNLQYMSYALFRNYSDKEQPQKIIVPEIMTALNVITGKMSRFKFVEWLDKTFLSDRERTSKIMKSKDDTENMLPMVAHYELVSEEND